MIVLSLIGAFAQTPLLTPSATPAAEIVYVTPEQVVSKRFADDAEPKHVTFTKGQALRVLFREKGWVRVRDGERYGWVPEAAVGSEAPDATTVPVALPVE